MIQITHIAVYVRDLEKAKVFFETYFNAVPNEMYHNPVSGLKTYFLTFGNDTRLELMTRPQLESSDDICEKCGYTHLAFSVGDREAVDSLTARLAADGYTVISGPRVTGDGYYESCVKVVENLQVEITE